MKCESIIYSDHAITQMFKRDINTDDVNVILKAGEIINEYLYDTPYPSYLVLGFINMRPLHLVIAKNEQKQQCIVITAYQPDRNIWDETFRIKKK